LFTHYSLAEKLFVTLKKNSSLDSDGVRSQIKQLIKESECETALVFNCENQLEEVLENENMINFEKLMEQQPVGDRSSKKSRSVKSEKVMS